MMTIDYLVHGAVVDLKDRLEREYENDQFSELSNLVHEVADSRVPIYTHDLLNVAKSDIWLVVSEPEL